MKVLVPGLTLIALGATWTVSAGPVWARASSRPVVSVQPFVEPTAGVTVAGGATVGVAETGALVRNEIARLIRSRGFHVVTSIPRVDGTAQYVLLARDHHLSAFISGDLQVYRRGRTATITFLIWNGATGSVLGRWSVSGPPRRLHRSAARGFLKHLGRALEAAEPPPLPLDQDPAPPMFIDASDRI